MGVEQTTLTKSYECDGSQVTFEYDFKIIYATDLVVINTVSGVNTTKTYGDDYFVTNVGDDDGGNVTFYTAPVANTSLFIYRDNPLKQEVDFNDGDALRAENLETIGDRPVLQIQQVNNKANRSIRIPITDEMTLSDLPKKSTRKNRYLKFDSNGDISTETKTTLVAGLDHGDLSGLSDDDHSQYHNNTRGDARYYTKTLLNAGQLDTRYYTEGEVDSKLTNKSDTTHNHDTDYADISHNHDSRYYTETEVDNKLALKADDTDLTSHTGNSTIHYTEASIDKYTQAEVDALVASASGTTDHSALSNLDYASSGHTGFVSDAQLVTTSGNIVSQIPTDFYTTSEVDTISGSLSTEIDSDISAHEAGGSHDGRYYTETELDNGQLDSRYYTETELDNGQLDSRYYTESEVNTISGTLQTEITLNSTHRTSDGTDHTYINQDVTTNANPQFKNLGVNKVPAVKLDIIDTGNSLANITTSANNRSAGWNAYNDNSVSLMMRSWGSAHGSSYFGNTVADNATIVSNNGSILFGTVDAYDIILGTNNTSRMIIDSAGKVGIGTESPVYDLEIVDFGDSVEMLTTYSTSTTQYPRLFLTKSNSDTEAYVATVSGTILGEIAFNGIDNEPGRRIGALIGVEQVDAPGGNRLYSDMYFTTDDASGLSEKMRITTNGNVGIGTLSPSKKLEVSGNGKFSGTVIGSEPTESNHFATKNYVDNITHNATQIQGYDVTAPEAADDGYYLSYSHGGGNWVLVSGTSGGGGGTSDHSALLNLDYASSGHTGFASTTALTTTSGDLSSEIDADISTHASSSDHDGRYYTETEVDTWRNSVTQTEMGYLHGVTSDVQTQIDSKIGSAGVTYENLASNGDVGTGASQVAQGNHDHSGTYAPAAEGVTNGDSHDHNGGDGAQISYSNLSDVPASFTPSSHNNTAHSETYITSAGVTYENLNTNSDVGTGASQVAQGNHTHSDLHTREHSMTGTSDHTANNWKIFYSDGSGDVQELAMGTTDYVLKSNGPSAAPSWQEDATSSGGGTAAGDKIYEGDTSVETIDAGTGYIEFKVDNTLQATISGTGMKVNEQLIIPTDEPTTLVNGSIWIA